MRVLFDSLPGFVKEIKADKDSIQCVRISLETQSVNSGVEQVFLKAGFLIDDSLRELRLYCGDDLAGGGTDGTSAFTRASDLLVSACSELGVEVRGGAYSG